MSYKKYIIFNLAFFKMITFTHYVFSVVQKLHTLSSQRLLQGEKVKLSNISEIYSPNHMDLQGLQRVLFPQCHT